MIHWKSQDNEFIEDMKEQQLNIRPLTAGDFEAVVNIDAKITGRTRPGFFEKRLAAAVTDPDYFIYIGCELQGMLKGYLFARLQEGEYGVSEKVAVVDAIGVEPASTGQGIGRTMMEDCLAVSRHKKVSEIQTQVDWRNLEFLRFLSACKFQLAPRQILEREVDYMDTRISTDPVKLDVTGAGEKDYSDPNNDEATALARDVISVRSLNTVDMAALVRIDKKVTGVDHRRYYQRKTKEVLDETGIRVSLVAENDGQVAGFIMARVDFGEFDRAEPVAVLDSIAVDPDYGHHQVGSAMLSQLLANLATLRLETVRTEIDTDHFDVLNFLMKNGFRNSQRLSFSCKV